MEQEYIKDDIVLYNNKIHIIIDILGLDNYELSGVKYPVNQAELSGVPLTSEILEKNGWKLIHGFYWSPNEEEASIGLSSQTGYVWKAYIGRQPLRSDINSVSDLQHLLFGLGINHEMKL